MNAKKEIAIAAVELFEDLLEEHGIIIPDEDRPEDNDTPLYGITWDNMVESVMVAITEGLDHLYDEQKCLLKDVIDEREGLPDMCEKGIALDNKYGEVQDNLAALDTAMSLMDLDYDDFHNL